MSNIEGANTRPSFFPHSKTTNQPGKTNGLQKSILKRNDIDRMKEIESISRMDARVDIPDSIKDFSRIKKAVDASKPIDKSDKIASLKSQIDAGTYQIDYDALADRMLTADF